MVGPPRELTADIMRFEKKLSQTFKEFAQSGKAGGVILILCTIASLLIANSASGPS